MCFVPDFRRSTGLGPVRLPAPGRPDVNAVHDYQVSVELAGLPELTEKGAEKATEGAIEGVEDKVAPDSSGLRTAAKGAAAAAAVGAAAMAARELASRVGGDDKSGDTGDEG